MWQPCKHIQEGCRHYSTAQQDWYSFGPEKPPLLGRFGCPCRHRDTPWRNQTDTSILVAAVHPATLLGDPTGFWVRSNGTRGVMGHWENIGLPEAFDGIVRLFPLPNLVLFPHVIQALHIFEPRYCEMLSEALESDHLIAMALLDTGWEHTYQGQPRIANVVCIGRIISHTPTGDGRHNIFLAGIQRAKIVEELVVNTGFRQAKVEILEDVPIEDDAKSEACRDELLAVFRAMIPMEVANSKTFAELLTKQLPLGVLTDVIAYAVNLPIATKQYLLGEPNVEARYRVLMDNLTTLVDSQDSPEIDSLPKGLRRGFPPPFSNN